MDCDDGYGERRESSESNSGLTVDFKISVIKIRTLSVDFNISSITSSIFILTVFYRVNYTVPTLTYTK